jgi:hypothetical protein|tara:strand:- start:886 stop:1074 length:189 start_codon:yes stop_codon:yes gene_type:complete
MTFNNPSKVNFTYINKLMEEIHDHSDEIYESLADQDYITLDHNITSLIQLLKQTQLNYQDEI